MLWINLYHNLMSVTDATDIALFVTVVFGLGDSFFTVQFTMGLDVYQLYIQFLDGVLSADAVADCCVQDWFVEVCRTSFNAQTAR